MDEEFWFTLAALIALTFLAAPIISLFLSFGIRRRLDAQAAELAQLKRGLYARLDRPAEASPDAAAQPQPESTPIAVPLQREPPAAPSIAAAFPPPRPPVQSPPIRPMPPKPPNAFEDSLRQILAAAWNWLIVGKDHRTPGVSVEYAVATNWLVRIGVIIVVFGMGFFLKYSSEHGWLNDWAKVSLTLLVGTALITIGIRLLNKRYHLLAQGLLGAGLATLYAATFAAANRFHLIEPGIGFLLMALITVGAGIMAVRFNSLLVALLGLLGGYGTPVMLATDAPNLTGLYTYLLLLGLGVLGIAYRRSWRLLNVLAFAATYGLLGASLISSYRDDQFWSILPFVVAFFMLFSTVTFIHQVANSKKATVLELLMLILNATLFFGISYGLIRSRFASEWSAAIALGLAMFYSAHLYAVMARRIRDRGLALSFVALAAFFLIVTLPLLLSDLWLTLCWAVQALILLWVSTKLNSRLLGAVAYGLFSVVVVRFFAWDLYDSFARSLPLSTTPGAYGRLLIERVIAYGVPVLCLAGAMQLTRRPARAAALALDEANDIRLGQSSSGIVLFCAIAALAMLFSYTSLELNACLSRFVPGLRVGGISVYWSLFALALIIGGILRGQRSLRFTGLLLFAIVAVKVFMNDLAHLDQVYRIVAFILLGIVLLAGAFVYLRFKDRFTSSQTGAGQS